MTKFTLISVLLVASAVVAKHSSAHNSTLSHNTTEVSHKQSKGVKSHHNSTSKHHTVPGSKKPHHHQLKAASTNSTRHGKNIKLTTSGVHAHKNGTTTSTKAQKHKNGPRDHQLAKNSTSKAHTPKKAVTQKKAASKAHGAKNSTSKITAHKNSTSKASAHKDLNSAALKKKLAAKLAQKKLSKGNSTASHGKAVNAVKGLNLKPAHGNKKSKTHTRGKPTSTGRPARKNVDKTNKKGRTE